MESQDSIMAVDMNNPANLALYSEMLLFKSDMSRPVLSYYEKSNAEQRVLQHIAHSQKLEYEYSVASKLVTISRPSPLNTTPSFVEPSILNTMGFDFDFDAYLHTPLPLSVQPSDGPEPVAGFPGHPRFLPSLPGTDLSLDPDMPWLNDTLYEAIPFETATLSPQSPLQMSRAPSTDTVPNMHKVVRRGCGNCRRKHLRCDGNFPPCRNCIKRKIDCSYQPNNLQGEELGFTENKISSPGLSDRRSSMQSEASSGYQEIVFDSNSVYSESQASAASGASGRRGRLSAFARAGMNAVKKVGACWRCKFLRKTCDSHNPCALCPKRGSSSWQSVGCHRGDFKSKEPSMTLCPRQQSLYSAATIDGEDDRVAAVVSLQTSLERRQEWIENASSTYSSSLQTQPIASMSRILFVGEIYPEAQFPSAIQPLIQCVLAISWEIMETKPSIFRLGDVMMYDDLTHLLLSAAAYQANIDSDQLIAQSLICLRTCLEALRAKEAGFFRPRFHRECINKDCKFECFNLQKPITIFLDELSRVFFKKTNLRNKEVWWLSTFYSFCIQSYVKKILKQVEMYHWSDETYDGKSKQYLHLPLRLFIASSGVFDPLSSPANMDFEIMSREGLPTQGDYQHARTISDQSNWISQGILGSGHYLQKLFEDNGAILNSVTNNTTKDKPVHGLSTPNDFSDPYQSPPPSEAPTSTMKARSKKSATKKGHWTEIDDPESRRRVQNRIAQRKFRERAQAAKARQIMVEESRRGDVASDDMNPNTNYYWGTPGQTTEEMEKSTVDGTAFSYYEYEERNDVDKDPYESNV